MPYSAFEFGTMSLSMVLTGSIVYYLKHLETIGCKCAMNYKRTYIMSFHIFGLAFGAANLLSGNGVAEYIAKSSFVMPILSVLVLAIITNIVFTLMYVEELKKDNCDCSESVFRTMMYILSIISAITWGLALLLGIIFGGLILSMPKIQVPTLKSSKGKK
jgi:uncharacterized membrane-anchored protein